MIATMLNVNLPHYALNFMGHPQNEGLQTRNVHPQNIHVDSDGACDIIHSSGVCLMAPSYVADHDETTEPESSINLRDDPCATPSQRSPSPGNNGTPKMAHEPPTPVLSHAVRPDTRIDMSCGFRFAPDFTAQVAKLQESRFHSGPLECIIGQW